MSPSRVIFAYRHRSREETYGRFRAAAAFLPPPRVNRMLKLSPPLAVTPAWCAVSFVDNGVARWGCDTT
jgi:hypothetical protein